MLLVIFALLFCLPLGAYALVEGARVFKHSVTLKDDAPLIIGFCVMAVFILGGLLTLLNEVL